MKYRDDVIDLNFNPAGRQATTYIGDSTPFNSILIQYLKHHDAFKSFLITHHFVPFALLVYSDPGPRLLHASQRLWLSGAQGPLGRLTSQQHEHLGQLSAANDQPVAVEHDDGERSSQHG